MIRYPYRPIASGENRPALSSYSKDFLLSIYRKMLRIRLIEFAIEAKYKEDQMKTPIHLVIGQEATSVGACAALTNSDHLFSTHRTHGNYLAKGGSLKGMLSEMFCRANGCAGSRGGSMHLIDKSVGMMSTSAIVGGIIPIATGNALAQKITAEKFGSKAVSTVVFFGDAANEEGVTWESLNFAALKKLPIIYFCENNFYSVQSPLHFRQPEASLQQKAKSFGLHSVLVDGNDVLAVYEATKKAVEHIQSGRGPVYIEAPVYRWRAHGGAYDDTSTGYREQEEVDHWMKLCPIESLKRELLNSGQLTEVIHEQYSREIDLELNEAFEHAVTSPNPAPEDLYKHVYAP